MAIQMCTVSGTVKNLSNQALTSVTIRAYVTSPFFHTDGTWVANYEVTTTPDNTGAWSLPLLETTTPNRTMTIVIDYPGSTTDRRRKEYTCQIPNAATANFSDIAVEN